MTAAGADSFDIKPLTKRRKDTGELYRRRADAELQIGRVIALGRDHILDILKHRDRDSPHYLLDETIVYLLRGKGDDREFRDALYLELNRRIWRLLAKFRTIFSEPADFEDFGQKIETQIVRRIFDLGSDAGDYAQVNFGDYVVMAAKVERRGALVKISRDREMFETVYGEGESDGDGANQIENSVNDGSAPVDYTLMLREDLGKLPPHLLTVAVLLADGWQIESRDPLEPTISKQLGVSSRTIRNWMNEARRILSGYQGEVRR